LLCGHTDEANKSKKTAGDNPSFEYRQFEINRASFRHRPSNEAEQNSLLAGFLQIVGQ
jgi:hypothetical protein